MKFALFFSIFIIFFCVTYSNNNENTSVSEKKEILIREKRNLGVLLRNPAVMTTVKAAVMASLGITATQIIKNHIEPELKRIRKAPNFAVAKHRFRRDVALIRTRRNALLIGRIVAKILSLIAYGGVAFAAGVGANEYNNYRTALAESRLRRSVIQ